MSAAPPTSLPSPVRKAITLGALSCLVIVISSGMRGWPFPTLTAEPWLFQFNGTNTAVKYLFLAAFYIACAGLCYSWICLLNLARDNRLSTKNVFWAFGIWSAILFFSTPLFSGDVYVYFLDGEAVQRGFDPYSAGVSAMGATPEVHMVHMLWRDTTTMYGPIFIRMVQGIAVLTHGHLIAGVLVLRGIALASIAASALALKSLAQRFNRPVPSGLTFAILNPITMLHMVAGSHNDATMIGLLTCGLAVGFGARGWPGRLLALALCAAAGAFKIPGFAGALVLGWAWARAPKRGNGAGVDVSHWRRVFGAAAGGAGALVFFELQTLATGLSWGWLGASNVPGLAHPLLSPPNAVALSFGSLVGQGYQLNSLTRPVALVIAALVATWLLVRTGRRLEPYKVVRSFGWALLIIAWAGPAVYPWYIGWGVVLVGAMGTTVMRKPLIIATCAVIFLIAPGGYGVLDIPGASWRVVMAFLTTSVMAYAVVDALHRGLSGRTAAARSI